MFITNEHSQILNMLKREEEILDQAIAALKRETNLAAEKIGTEMRQLTLPPNDDAVADAMMRIEFPAGAAEFWVEVKPAINNIAIGQTAHRFAGDPGRWLLVTRHVNPRLAEALRELRVQFIDTVGNAFINVPPLFVQIQGNRRQEQMIETAEEGMLGRAGLKLVFALLCRRDLWNATYRDTAKAARVALGTVAGVMKDLTAKGYLIRFADQDRRMVRQKDLLRKWMAAYAEKLRPRNVLGKYKATRVNLWQEENIQRFDAQWGGEVAAHLLTRYNKPEVTTIYARKPITDLVLDLKLRHDKQGDIEIRERFWDFENIEPDGTVVPPLLIYADLMATGDPRNIETAKIIYDDYLQRRIEQD
jgi:hypothetical protein